MVRSASMLHDAFCISVVFLKTFFLLNHFLSVIFLKYKIREHYSLNSSAAETFIL